MFRKHSWFRKCTVYFWMFILLGSVIFLWAPSRGIQRHRSKLVDSAENNFAVYIGKYFRKRKEVSIYSVHTPFFYVCLAVKCNCLHMSVTLNVLLM